MSLSNIHVLRCGRSIHNPTEKGTLTRLITAALVHNTGIAAAGMSADAAYQIGSSGSNPSTLGSNFSSEPLLHAVTTALPPFSLGTYSSSSIGRKCLRSLGERLQNMQTLREKGFNVEQAIASNYACRCMLDYLWGTGVQAAKGTGPLDGRPQSANEFPECSTGKVTERTTTSIPATSTAVFAHSLLPGCDTTSQGTMVQGTAHPIVSEDSLYASTAIPEQVEDTSVRTSKLYSCPMSLLDLLVHELQLLVGRHWDADHQRLVNDMRKQFPMLHWHTKVNDSVQESLGVLRILFWCLPYSPPLKAAWKQIRLLPYKSCTLQSYFFILCWIVRMIREHDFCRQSEDIMDDGSPNSVIYCIAADIILVFQELQDRAWDALAFDRSATNRYLRTLHDRMNWKKAYFRNFEVQDIINKTFWQCRNDVGEGKAVTESSIINRELERQMKCHDHKSCPNHFASCTVQTLGRTTSLSNLETIRGFDSLVTLGDEFEIYYGCSCCPNNVEPENLVFHIGEKARFTSTSVEIQKTRDFSPQYLVTLGKEKEFAMRIDEDTGIPEIAPIKYNHDQLFTVDGNRQSVYDLIDTYIVTPGCQLNGKNSNYLKGSSGHKHVEFAGLQQYLTDLGLDIRNVLFRIIVLMESSNFLVLAMGRTDDSMFIRYGCQERSCNFFSFDQTRVADLKALVATFNKMVASQQPSRRSNRLVSEQEVKDFYEFANFLKCILHELSDWVPVNCHFSNSCHDSWLDTFEARTTLEFRLFPCPQTIDEVKAVSIFVMAILRKAIKDEIMKREVVYDLEDFSDLYDAEKCDYKMHIQGSISRCNDLLKALGIFEDVQMNSQGRFQLQPNRRPKNKQ